MCFVRCFATRQSLGADEEWYGSFTKKTRTYFVCLFVASKIEPVSFIPLESHDQASFACLFPFNTYLIPTLHLKFAQAEHLILTSLSDYTDTKQFQMGRYL